VHNDCIITLCISIVITLVLALFIMRIVETIAEEVLKLEAEIMRKGGSNSDV